MYIVHIMYQLKHSLVVQGLTIIRIFLLVDNSYRRVNTNYGFKFLTYLFKLENEIQLS